MIAKIHVILKKAVLDPQGKAVQRALQNLGFEGVDDVRIGKFIVMKMEDTEDGMARSRVEQMCRKLLANPVIEDFSFEIERETK